MLGNTTNFISTKKPFVEEMQTISYTASEEQKKILVWERSKLGENFTEVIYSKHNCEVLDRRIEKAILEEEKRWLERYTFDKKATPIFVASLVGINLCYMGEWNLYFWLMGAIAIYFKMKAYYQSKKEYTTTSYLVQLIEELKKKNIQLSEEELALLGVEDRKTYEQNGELSISNALIVCNQKMLKKHFGEK